MVDVSKLIRFIIDLPMKSLSSKPALQRVPFFFAALAVCFNYGLSPGVAQEVVRGTVLDENKQPLNGVSITVRSSGAQTGTDASGSFQLSASIGDTLEFTFLGYEPSIRVVEDRDPIMEIMAVAAATDLEEVVIVGYGTQKKSNLTGQ